MRSAIIFRLSNRQFWKEWAFFITNQGITGFFLALRGGEIRLFSPGVSVAIHDFDCYNINIRLMPLIDKDRPHTGGLSRSGRAIRCVF